jgi:hypothetical protein
VGVEIPLPLRAIWVGEFAALLLTSRLPVTDPVAVGAKFTLNVVLCPAAKVSGVNPLIVKPAPVMLSVEILMFVLPVLLNVTVRLLAVPTVTFPKLKLVVLAATWLVAAPPAPLRATVVGEVGALLMIVRLPVAVLVVVGAKLTVNAAEVPGATVSGNWSPLNLNPLPEIVACETLRFELPWFLIVTFWVLVAPSGTLPKLTVAGMVEIAAWVDTGVDWGEKAMSRK